MTATQVSFAAFALAPQAASCSPPAAIPGAAPVVAHGLGLGSGGECSLRARRLRAVSDRYLGAQRYQVTLSTARGSFVSLYHSRARAHRSVVAWGRVPGATAVLVDLGASA